jgi:hypothetical protein
MLDCTFIHVPMGPNNVTVELDNIYVCFIKLLKKPTIIDVA